MTSSQRKILSAEASKINAVVIIGQNGLTDGVVQKCRASLDDHELLKVKFNDYKDEKRELTDELVRQTGAELVRIIGNNAVLYKKSSIEEKQRHLI